MPEADREPIRIRFGGGRNTQALSDEVGETECVEGENFVLTQNSNIMKPRGPLEIVGTAPNGEEIRGFAQLQKQDGTLSTLVQAGTGLYEWDGTASGFTLKLTVNSQALLRGPLEANFTLDEEVIITDLNKVEFVKTWDGTTVSDMTTGLSPNDFYAKYCVVEDDRAIFANVKTTADTPHLVVISEVENKNALTNKRPASANSESDSVFLPVPNLEPINGLTSGFGRVVLSTDRKVFYLTGSSAKDYDVTALYDGSGVSGGEGLINIGNDILIPGQGAINTLRATDTFGDVSTDDLSQEIFDEISAEDEWQAAYNPLNQRVYLIPESANKCHVLHKFIIDRATAVTGSRLTTRQRTSPWTKYTTKLNFGFSTSCLWRMKDPIDGLLKVYCGDSSGNVYQFEGDGSLDGAVNDIAVFRESRSFSVAGGQLHDLKGYVKYRRPSTQQQLTLTMQYSGDAVYSETVTIDMQGLLEGSFFGGDVYFGGDFYFGSAESIRPFKHQFEAPGSATDASVKIAVDATDDFGIEEVALLVSASEARP